MRSQPRQGAVQRVWGATPASKNGFPAATLEVRFERLYIQTPCLPSSAHWVRWPLTKSGDDHIGHHQNQRKHSARWWRFTYLASSVFVPTKPRNSGSRLRRKSLFLLVGKHPKPFEQTAPLVWLRGILPLSSYRPLLIFRSRLRSGNCGFSEGTGASPSKVSLSDCPACFRKS